MIWIMIMYEKNFAIINIYMYDLLPLFSTHILSYASWIE